MRTPIRVTVCMGGRTFVMGTRQETDLVTMTDGWRVELAESFPSGAGTWTIRPYYDTEESAILAGLAVIVANVFEKEQAS